LDVMLCVKSTTEVGKHPGQALAPLYSVQLHCGHQNL